MDLMYRKTLWAQYHQLWFRLRELVCSIAIVAMVDANIGDDTCEFEKALLVRGRPA